MALPRFPMMSEFSLSSAFDDNPLLRDPNYHLPYGWQSFSLSSITTPWWRYVTKKLTPQQENAHVAGQEDAHRPDRQEGT